MKMVWVSMWDVCVRIRSTTGSLSDFLTILSVVQQVAQLAKLALSPEEEKRMGGEMEGILAFAQALQQVDTTGVPMTAHVIPTQNVLREDEPETPFDREKLLASAPTRTEECVTVPKTFE